MLGDAACYRKMGVKWSSVIDTGELVKNGGRDVAHGEVEKLIVWIHTIHDILM